MNAMTAALRQAARGARGVESRCRSFLTALLRALAATAA
jgi:hypothetical protein